MINKHYTSLSGDYPAEVIKNLEHEYDFAQFTAGSVGSQRFKGFDGTYDFALTEKVGKLFSSMITSATQEMMPAELDISTGSLKVEYGSSQLRLIGDIKLRDWVFKSVNEPLKGEFTILKIGDLLMLGTPCDFSGEIVKLRNFDGLADSNDMKLIITSFNGNYTGYITEDVHYLREDDEELYILNWVGPHFGQYFTEIIEAIIEKADE
jgi:hypothetical protein